MDEVILKSCEATDDANKTQLLVTYRDGGAFSPTVLRFDYCFVFLVLLTKITLQLSLLNCYNIVVVVDVAISLLCVNLKYVQVK